MTLEDWSYIAQIAGVISVAVTLIYLTAASRRMTASAEIEPLGIVQ